ncbi:FAD-binding oxidoreductase [Trinickia terrae]|uniref:FAD-binding oxidoreductase n=1 Tax=Trinickia terrae TaxID=2571161 RepID=A0A4U1HZF8_9BURK|nr:FAD-dependent oxidoreductase [Trinickia terrae]TKC86287.1 FAD-binding oxidoreductase [Trinickia terrae]
MNFDYAVIGTGIQALVVLDRMRALGLNACGVEPESRTADGQVHRLPFYVHRGHCYAERELAGPLRDTYANWQNMIRRLGVKIRSTESYVGFTGDSSRWTQTWDALDIPYAQTSLKTGLLSAHRLSEAYAFPHMSFDGRELLARLRQANRDFLMGGAIRHVSRCWQGYRLFVGDRLITAKKLIVCAGAHLPGVLEALPDVEARLPVQTRVCQVLTMRGPVPNASIVVPDAQMSIAPQYTADGSTVLLYTHGANPIRTDKNHRIDIARLELQLDALRATLPGLSDTGRVRGIYMTLETESAAFGGKGTRTGRRFVEQVDDDVLCVLPGKPSFAMNASDELLSLLNAGRRSAQETECAAEPSYFAAARIRHAFEGAQHRA